MGNTYFDTGEERAAKVNSLFARIAPRYDLINDLQSFGLHRYWKKRVVQLALAHPRPGLRALDVCCGTGDIAAALAKQGVEVTGLDFNEQMLAVANARNTERAKARVGIGPSPAHHPRFLRGDALALPFPDDWFDIVTVGYGLRNLASWEAGLTEMFRVLKPAGSVVVLDFGKPENSVWRALYFGYLRGFVPCLGLVFCGDASAYAYILESLKHYPAQRGVAARMRELGLVDVQIHELLGGAMAINLGRKAQK